MKVLIIGATGKLAKPVVNHMAEQGFALRLFSRSIQPGTIDKKHEMLQGDLFNPSDLEQAMEGCDG